MFSITDELTKTRHELQQVQKQLHIVSIFQKNYPIEYSMSLP